MKGLGIIIIAALLATAGDFAAKLWVNDESRTTMFYVTVLLYWLSVPLVAYSFRFNDIIVGSLLYILLNSIIFFAINTLYFKQAYTWTQLIGIGLGLAAICIMEIE